MQVLPAHIEVACGIHLDVCAAVAYACKTDFGGDSGGGFGKVKQTNVCQRHTQVKTVRENLCYPVSIPQHVLLNIRLLVFRKQIVAEPPL